ncbi:hypothetical protein J7T55_010184 [Diaporthe amygdali]|uniref:uncharacterized protein n=1 Tax=Phomopsis amygdali TaxID=1214568 RepID=UPI0022FE48FA|nr:uncharacterized protein J7T55_010184 [Diaporthe amygdali]KAJ0113940.1 hypothetical protein J7T55_010184 [Diaporthe amygdali]
MVDYALPSRSASAPASHIVDPTRSRLRSRLGPSCPPVDPSTVFAQGPSSRRTPHASTVPEDVQLAIEALSNLKEHCPDWATRLDELSGQIEQRQLDLAEVAEQQSTGSPDTNGRPQSTRSVRNRGSTQSLKPNDDGEAHPEVLASGRTLPAENKNAAHEARRASVASRRGVDRPHKEQDSRNGQPPLSPSAVEGQTNQVIAIASAQARATLRRTQLSKKRAAAAESMLSVEGATPSKYRNRNLVMVYYDSYVQSFFEELVKFVSASRNLMRKAKMAAKVAQIKKMAELEVPDDDSSSSDEEPHLNGSANPDFIPPQTVSPMNVSPAVDGELDVDLPDGNGEPAEGATESRPEQSNGNGPSPTISPAQPPNARESIATNGHGNGNGLKSPSQALKPSSIPAARPKIGGGYSTFSSFGLGFGDSQQPDVFEELDKGLESVQSMCEHAAHQFLRDGDCSDEIVKIKDRLTGTKTSAEKEIQRMLDQDETLEAKLSQAPARPRSYRPQSMRRASLAAANPTAGKGGGESGRLFTGGFDGNKLTADSEPSPFGASGAVLEVDDGTDEDSRAPPKLQYRSTRAMGALKTVS